MISAISNNNNPIKHVYAFSIAHGRQQNYKQLTTMKRKPQPRLPTLVVHLKRLTKFAVQILLSLVMSACDKNSNKWKLVLKVSILPPKNLKLEYSIL